MLEKIIIRTLTVETDGEYCHDECVYYSTDLKLCRHFGVFLRKTGADKEKHVRCLDCRKATREYKEGSK